MEKVRSQPWYLALPVKELGATEHIFVYLRARPLHRRCREEGVWVWVWAGHQEAWIQFAFVVALLPPLTRSWS